MTSTLRTVLFFFKWKKKKKKLWKAILILLVCELLRASYMKSYVQCYTHCAGYNVASWDRRKWISWRQIPCILFYKVSFATSIFRNDFYGWLLILTFKYPTKQWWTMIGRNFCFFLSFLFGLTSAIINYTDEKNEWTKIYSKFNTWLLLFTICCIVYIVRLCPSDWFNVNGNKRYEHWPLAERPINDRTMFIFFCARCEIFESRVSMQTIRISGFFLPAFWTLTQRWLVVEAG